MDIFALLDSSPFGVLLLILLGVMLFTGLCTVQQQTIAIVETFGKYSRTLQPGLNWIIPFGIQRVAATVHLQITQVESRVEIKTIDNMFVTLPVSLMVRVDTAGASAAHYTLNNPETQISTWVLNTLRAITSSMSLADLFADRAKLAEEVQSTLAEQLLRYGYVIEGVLVDQPTVSPEVQSAFNRVVASQREKEAAVQEAEAKRIRIVGESRAEAESQMLRAEGLASARKILAKGLSEAVKEAKDQGIEEADIMHLLLETNRLDTIKYASEKGKLVVMDLRSEGTKPTLNIG